MDQQLISIREIQKLEEVRGNRDDFVKSDEFLKICSKHKAIPRDLKKSSLNKTKRDLYIDYLVSLTQEYIDENSIVSWDHFKSKDNTRRVAKLLFEFGVPGEVNYYGCSESKTENSEELTKLTFKEFYELCQIQFNYEGSYGSFKKMVSKKYGSFAEYCLERGYDINNTKWENDETAVRVAEKIGSLEDIKTKSNSLYKYLLENGLTKRLVS
jgi:hypothetical protein